MAACSQGGLGLVIVRLEHDDPCLVRQPMPEPLGLACNPLRLVRFQSARENLLDEVAPQAALHLGGRPFLGQLERENR